MGIRTAEKAGTWYPGDEKGLTLLCEQCFAQAKSDRLTGTPVAGIVPHAGLLFSGAIAAKTFEALATAQPDTLIIFGAVHTMSLRQPALWTDGEWETPLGTLEVDATLADLLLSAGLGEANESPHRGDNAIELQMPLIKHRFPNAKILPIAVPPLQGIEAFGERVWAALEGQERSIAVVGSTDLTHYGDSFGVTPAGYGEAALDWAAKNDQRLIDLMLEGKAEAMVTTAANDRSA
ncbi:MAG: AmmeMemoRadiSam system protein B, partial [Planctomycetota bacterium]